MRRTLLVRVDRMIWWAYLVLLTYIVGVLILHMAEAVIGWMVAA